MVTADVFDHDIWFMAYFLKISWQKADNQKDKNHTSPIPRVLIANPRFCKTVFELILNIFQNLVDSSISYRDTKQTKICQKPLILIKYQEWDEEQTFLLKQDLFAKIAIKNNKIGLIPSKTSLYSLEEDKNIK